jgi:hypothetical protein
VQVIRDTTRLATVTDRLRLRTATPTALLDDTSRIEPLTSDALSIRDLVREASKRISTPSVVIVVDGSLAPLAEFRAVETVFGSDTQVIAFRAETGAASRISRVADSTVVTVGSLDDLSRLVRRVRP